MHQPPDTGWRSQSRALMHLRTNLSCLHGNTTPTRGRGGVVVRDLSYVYVWKMQVVAMEQCLQAIISKHSMML